MKRNDCILAAAIFLFAGLLSVMFSLSGNEQGNYVTVTVDKKVYGTYLLDETQDIEILTEFGHNNLHVENGTVCMTEADCPDGYCKRQGEISTEKETIVCLPHKLVVEIQGAKPNGGRTEEQTDGQTGEDYDILVK